MSLLLGRMLNNLRMKQFFLLLLLSTFHCLSAFAQAIYVEGVVLDENHQPMPSANVALYLKDTVFYKGGTTNNQGVFKLSGVKKGDYRMEITYVGYTPEKVDLYQVQKNCLVGEIVLHRAAFSLSDVAIVADQQKRKADRLIVLPTHTQLKTSSTSLDLLSQMMLPGLVVNTVDRSVQVEGKTPEFRINGMKVKLSEIEALVPEDIVRVEYVDRPGVQYDPGVSAVINYITRPVESGLLFSVNLQNALTTGFGNDGFSLKWNRKRSEFSLSYDLVYRDYAERKKDRWEGYLQAGEEPLQRQQIGSYAPFDLADHGLTLSYNLTEPDAYVFNATVRTSLHNRKLTDRARLVVPQDVMEMHNREKTTTSIPEIDLYYSRRFTARQTFSLNLVGGYAATQYQRRYQEEADSLYLALSDTKGKKLGLIGELKYENLLSDKLTLTAGLKENFSRERNHYYQEGVYVKQKTSFTYLYMQAAGSWKKLNYILGVAGAMDRDNLWNNQYLTFFTFRPSVILTYSLSSKSSLQYLFLISSNSPDVAYLNTLTQPVNSLLATRGNPDLTPYRSYFNMLTYSYFHKLLYSQFRLRHAYHDRPIMDANYRDEERGMYVNTYRNQGNLQEYNASVYLKYGPFLHDIVTLQVTGNYTYSKSTGATYQHTLKNCWFYFQGTFSYRNMALLVSATTRPKSLWGEIVTADETYSSLVLQYNKQPFVVGIGLSYPFSSGWTAGSESLSAVTPYRSTTRIQDNGRMVFLKFSWNLAIGRKYKAGTKTLYNEANAGNILQAPSRN